MQSVFLGIVSLFSLADYQAADEIYLHPDSVYTINNESYSHYDILIDGVDKTCFLDSQMRGICYQACYDNQIKTNNQCVDIY